MSPSPQSHHHSVCWSHVNERRASRLTYSRRHRPHAHYVGACIAHQHRRAHSFDIVIPAHVEDDNEQGINQYECDGTPLGLVRVVPLGQELWTTIPLVEIRHGGVWDSRTGLRGEVYYMSLENSKISAPSAVGNNCWLFMWRIARGDV